jgi:hypothetical protein
VSLQRTHQHSQAFTSCQLAKDKSQQLIPAFEGLYAFIAFVLSDKPLELLSREESANLGENILAFHFAIFERFL